MLYNGILEDPYRTFIFDLLPLHAIVHIMILSDLNCFIYRICEAFLLAKDHVKFVGKEG